MFHPFDAAVAVTVWECERGAERRVGNERNLLVQHEGRVDLVGEHEGVVLADDVMQGAQLVLAQDAATGSTGCTE